MNNLYTLVKGITKHKCPNCGKPLFEYIRPINVKVWACRKCQEEYKPEFILGVEWERNRIKGSFKSLIDSWARKTKCRWSK